MLFFLFTGFLFGEKNNKKISKGIPVVKFIPGVYQIKSGKILKGGILLGACLTTIVGAILENNKGYDYYEQYLESVDVEEIIKLRKKSENSFKNRNYYLIGLFSVWAIHLIDLKFSKKKKGGLKGEIKNNSIHIGLYYSF